MMWLGPICDDLFDLDKPFALQLTRRGKA